MRARVVVLLAVTACSGSAATDLPSTPGPGEVQGGVPAGPPPTSSSTPPPESPPPSPDAGPALLAAGAACAANEACASGTCDDTGHCAISPSCARLHGGRTCGPKGDESCCVAIPVAKPSAPYSLDKYSVTAGRFRTFVERTGGDVRGWMQTHRPAWFPASWDAWLPRTMDDGTAVTGDNHVFAAGAGRDGVYQQLGPIHYGTEGPGNEGCLTKQVGNARTYRLPDAVNASLFADVQQYGQDVLDDKPQQCTTFFLFAAFCAWDGGRLPTLAELDYAWDAGSPQTHLYPWGMSPAPGGYADAYPFDPAGQGFGTVAPAGSDITMANYKYNFWAPARMRCLGDDPLKCDYSLYLAPPGRFPKGNGPFGHADLAGDVYNVAMPSPAPSPTAPPETLSIGLARTGAFDNHAIPNQHPVPGFRTWPATNKYLATGARCAR